MVDLAKAVRNSKLTEEETDDMMQAASIIDTMYVEVCNDLRMNSGSLSEEKAAALEQQKMLLAKEAHLVHKKEIVRKAFDIYSPFLLQRRAEEKQRKG